MPNHECHGRNLPEWPLSVVTSDSELDSSFITLMWPPKSPTKTCLDSASNLKRVKEDCSVADAHFKTATSGFEYLGGLT